MIFKDRTEAGQQLAKALAHYSNAPNAMVVGLPRGGVVTAAAVAKLLQLPLDIVVPRKIGAPSNAEFAIGAITEDGKAIIDTATVAAYGITQNYIDTEANDQQIEAQRRLHTYRPNKPALDLTDHTAIIVDDGVATGYTMLAAIESAKVKGAKKIVVAVPVAPPETLAELKHNASEVICIHPELPYGAVGASYRSFDQTSDEEVIKLLR